MSANINALFNEIEVLKNGRKNANETIKLKTEKIIEILGTTKEVLVYKNDEPHILHVEIKKSNKYDRAELASDLGVPQRFLNIPGIAELVEENKVSSKDLEGYWIQEAEPKLKVRKATKKDVERHQSSEEV